MHERSLVLFLVLATGCSSSAYSATVACKDPRTMEFAQGYLNLSSHSLGDVYRLEGTQHVHVGALPVDTKDVSETPPETQELSMSQGFELRAGTEVPETVKVDLKTLVSSKLKLIMRDAKIKTAPGMNWLQWANKNTEADQTFAQLSSAMGPPPGRMYVVNKIYEAKSFELGFGSELVTDADVKVIQVVDATVNVKFDCAGTLAISGGRPFYTALPYDYDGKSFSVPATK